MSLAPTLSPTRHDAAVADRFDALVGRFRAEAAADDFRLVALIRALGPSLAGLRILDLGCGKGRFARHLTGLGAEVVGVDLSAAMLAEARGIDRLRASARSLPFAAASFDAVVAVEVLEHVGVVAPVLMEARRVLRPGGRLLVVDKNALALNSIRPWLPAVAVKWLDTRRGRWMYPSGGPVRERWFVSGRLRREIGRAGFEAPAVASLLSPAEAARSIFRAVPSVRLMALWSGTVPGDPASWSFDR